MSTIDGNKTCRITRLNSTVIYRFYCMMHKQNIVSDDCLLLCAAHG